MELSEAMERILSNACPIREDEETGIRTYSIDTCCVDLTIVAKCLGWDPVVEYSHFVIISVDPE